MQYPIKLHIKKLGPMKYTWVKYYLAEKVLIEQYGPIKTEGQLMHYIYRKHGAGRYQILAWTKKYEGFWLFWIGDLFEHGYIRDINKNKDIEKLQGALYRAKTYEEREDIQEEMQMSREINNLSKTSKRHGPVGLIKNRPGIIYPYEDW